MQFRTSVFCGLSVLSLLLFIAGVVSPFATKTGVTASLWKTCAENNCSDIAPACNTANDTVNGGRAMCIIACILAGCAAISAFIETCWPDTLFALHNVILGVSTCVFSAIASAIGFALYAAAVCANDVTTASSTISNKDKSLRELDYTIGALGPLYATGFALSVIGTLIEMLGPKGTLDYEREEKAEKERMEREERHAREREQEMEQKRIALMLREKQLQVQAQQRSVSNNSSSSFRRAGSSMGNMGSSVPLPSGGSTIVLPSVKTPRGTVVVPMGPTPRSPRGGASVSGPRAAVTTATATTTTPRGSVIVPPPPPGSRGGTPRNNSNLNYNTNPSPVRAPIAGRSPRVAPYTSGSSNSSAAINDDNDNNSNIMPSDIGIGEDGSNWTWDAKVGMFWSEESGLFYDAARSVFVDPVTNQTFNPATNEWSG